jgi:hypothetical protein
MEPESTLPYLQVPATCPCLEPDRSSPHPNPTLRKSILLLSFNLSLDFSSGLLPSGFSTKTTADGEALSKYGRQLQIYWVSGQPTSGGHPAWGLGEVVKTPHPKKHNHVTDHSKSLETRLILPYNLSNGKWICNLVNSRLGQKKKKRGTERIWNIKVWCILSCRYPTHYFSKPNFHNQSDYVVYDAAPSQVHHQQQSVRHDTLCLLFSSIFPLVALRVRLLSRKARIVHS